MIGERLKARAAAVAERRCRQVAAELAREARGAGVTAKAEGPRIVLTAPKMTAQWLGNARLRFLGWMR